jgi:hypothetical protein
MKSTLKSSIRLLSRSFARGAKSGASPLIPPTFGGKGVADSQSILKAAHLQLTTEYIRDKQFYEIMDTFEALLSAHNFSDTLREDLLSFQNLHVIFTRLDQYLYGNYFTLANIHRPICLMFSLLGILNQQFVRETTEVFAGTPVTRHLSTILQSRGPRSQSIELFIDNATRGTEFNLSQSSSQARLDSYLSNIQSRVKLTNSS